MKALHVVVMLLLAACGQQERTQRPVTNIPNNLVLPEYSQKIDSASIHVTSLITLSDTGVILADPRLAYEDSDGRFLFTDRSDNHIRRFLPDGANEATIGRSGRGPGEFQKLTSAHLLSNGSILAYDFVSAQLTTFNSNGDVAGSLTMSPTPYDMRVLDGQWLLLIGHPGMSGKMLKVADPSSKPAVEFYEPKTFNGYDKQLKFLSWPMADGRDGVIFASVFGGDSLFAFDYHGNRLGAAQIQFDGRALPSLGQLFTQNGSVMQHPDGRWFHDQMPGMMKLVALAGGRCAIQLNRYDSRDGTDALEGGEIQIFGVSKLGGLEHLLTRSSDAGLIGRTSNGAPLFLGYANANAATYKLSRWDLQ